MSYANRLLLVAVLAGILADTFGASFLQSFVIVALIVNVDLLRQS